MFHLSDETDDLIYGELGMHLCMKLDFTLSALTGKSYPSPIFEGVQKFSGSGTELTRF